MNDARFDLNDDDEPPARLLQVLVVDDHPDNRRILQAILPELGCAVTAAGTGEEAVELALVIAFDLILMDFHLPDLTGDETAREIRNLGRSRRAFIARWTTDDSARLDAGLYDGELGKPVLCRAAADLVDEARRRAEFAQIARADEASQRSGWFGF